MSEGFVDRLEDEFRRIAAAPARSRRRPRAVAAALVAALCLTGGAALAVDGVLDPGDPTLGFGAGESDRAVVLTGKDSTGTPWQLATARADDAFCMSLRTGAVPDPAAASSGQCGGLTPGTLEATIGGREGGVAFAYGTVPDAAAVVVLTGAGESREAVVGDTGGVPGKFFVAELPPTDDVTVTVQDESGAAIATEPLRALVRAASPF